MSRVAIVGSCITRDLWPVRGEAMENLLYVSRTSLPSLFASRPAGFVAPGDATAGLGRHQQGALAADLTKTAVQRLVAFRPTHLILDFIDERFDLMAVGRAVFTHSWELETAGHLRTPAFRGARDIPRLSPAADRLWEDGAAEFAALVQTTPLRHARVILHAARWAEESRAADGRLSPIRDVEILAGQPARIAEHNALLARYETRLAQLMPPMDRVEAPELRIADEGHRWGLSPFHYVPEYYEAIWGQLEALGIARAA